VDALCVTFSIQTPSGETVELKPDGSNVDVTDENKMEYLSLVLRYRMLDSVSEQLTALLKGLYEVIPKSLLTIFDYQELDFYLSGLPTLNVTDWQNNSRVRHSAPDDDSEGIEQELEVIQWFWDVVGSFTDDQRARLLQFATGCSRVPVEGFRALTSASGIVHPFTLQMVPTGTPPLGMCPRAHTCFNRIDLPVYETKADLNSYLSLVSLLGVVIEFVTGTLTSCLDAVFRLFKWRSRASASSSCSDIRVLQRRGGRQSVGSM
jgi:E3 ubiquitin ligase SMURF1/2